MENVTEYGNYVSVLSAMFHGQQIDQTYTCLQVQFWVMGLCLFGVIALESGELSPIYCFLRILHRKEYQNIEPLDFFPILSIEK